MQMYSIAVFNARNAALFLIKNALLFFNISYMTVKERLKEFLKSKGLRDRDFCRALGVSNSYINSIRKSIHPDKMGRISELYPELNPVWLLTGRGDMLLDTNSNHVSGHNNTAVTGSGNKVTNNDITSLIELQKGYQDMIKEKDAQISRLITVIEKLSEK